jgi:hypothetical protein
MRNSLRLLLAALMLLATSHAQAWGREGHQVVANLAAAQLSPEARAEVDKLLALEPEASLASISTWADEHRNPATAPWHYVNFPRETCTFSAERDCPGGKCVVGAIEQQLAVLASPASADKRLAALKYLVHFVADVHQPLHAGYGDDRGGNTFQLQAFLRGSNLHALWDTGLIKNLHEDVGDLTARLQRTAPLSGRLASLQSAPITAVMAKVGEDLSIVHAAEESCRIVGLDGFYPERTVGTDYIERFTPMMEQRLILAGARLAGLLNGVFR